MSTTNKKMIRKGSGSHMSGILSSCCPFLTSAEKKEHGSSPPYSVDFRLRFHNLANSLTGSTQIPQTLPASTSEKHGLPQFSNENSPISFQKSDTSLTASEGECTIILAARAGCSSPVKASCLVDTAQFQPIPEGDWQTEKGQDEEEVTLLQRRQASDASGLVLERKQAKTMLREYDKCEENPEEPQSTSHKTLLLSLASKPNSISDLSNCPSPAKLVQTDELLVKDWPEPSRVSSSLEMLDARASPSPQTPKSPTEASSSSELLQISINQKPQETAQQRCDVATDSSRTSPSSELLDAICSLTAARGPKSRRSRMTSTRAPTPWSEAAAEQPDEVAAAETEEEPLERVSSSTGTSSYSSVSAAAESSSYHTLATPASSAEKMGDGAGGEAADAIAAAAAAAGADDVNLHYFCGEFRPDDHFMSRHAGLEDVTLASVLYASQQVTPMLSDSAVCSSPASRRRLGQSVASDSLLPQCGRCSPPRPPAANSGITLEAKTSNMDLTPP